jgi:hypothetical protein
MNEATIINGSTQQSVQTYSHFYIEFISLILGKKIPLSFYTLMQPRRLHEHSNSCSYKNYKVVI